LRTLPLKQGNQLRTGEVASKDPNHGRQENVNVAELDLLPYDEYIEQLPSKRMSSGVLVRDDHGRVLLVEPSYKPGWEIPGGVVEHGESPWSTAVRELHEEIGLQRPLGRLLVIDYVPPDNDSLPERMAFIFDGGHIDQSDIATLQLGPEIISARLCSAEEVHAKVNSILAKRLAAAIEATGSGLTLLCENGKRVV
jgi:8-oxo-dGTP pyrophosphatase MutT (NUDIX family)